MSARQLRAIEIAVIVLLAAAPLYVGAFRITLLNYVGVYALAALKLLNPDLEQLTASMQDLPKPQPENPAQQTGSGG